MILNKLWDHSTVVDVSPTKVNANISETHVANNTAEANQLSRRFLISITETLPGEPMLNCEQLTELNRIKVDNMIK